MITLLTKDGTKTGNGILIGGRLNLDGKYVFLVETDFGNRIEITATELVEMFIPGQICEYEDWDDDRAELCRSWSTQPCQKAPGHEGNHDPDTKHFNIEEGRCAYPVDLP